MPFLLRMCRSLSLVLLAVLGTSVLMYTAPGYFSDAREMDATHASVVRAELGQLRTQQASLPSLFKAEFSSWSHGDLGLSRQFGISVAQLIRERLGFSIHLLVAGVSLGWAIALLLAIPLSLGRNAGFDLTLATLTATCLAVPVGAMATFSLLLGAGGPVVVLAVVIAVRDTKLLHRLLQNAWMAPHVLHAQAQGLSPMRILYSHVAPRLRRELLSITVLSFTLALSALVPVEVVFDCPGVGQLAWSAAMNRDLPVLIAITAIMAACIGLAGCLTEPGTSVESTQCV